MMTPMPTAISEAEVKIGSVVLRVFHLDNGHRVIDARSMENFMEALASGSLMLSSEEAEAAVRQILTQ